MTTIHELSSITAHPDFDLFTVPPTQITVDTHLFSEHRPISILDANSIIQFVVPTGIDEYIQLRETLLYIKLKIDIAKTDSSDVVDADWEKVSTVNNLMHSLFKQIDLEIDGKSISHSPQTCI